MRWIEPKAARVVAWLDAQPLETLFLSVVSVAELRYGVARLPNGRRRKALAEGLETQVLPAFAGRILAFDLPATQAYADLMAKAQAAGQPIGQGLRPDRGDCPDPWHDGRHTRHGAVRRGGCSRHRSVVGRLKA